VAWVFDAKGVRNIWVADSPGAAQARQITSFTADDGFDIGELAWSPDTKSIAFHQGRTRSRMRPRPTSIAPPKAPCLGKYG